MRPEQVKLLIATGGRGFFTATVKHLRRSAMRERVVTVVGEDFRLPVQSGDYHVIATVFRQRMIRRPFGHGQHVEKGGDILMRVNYRHYGFPLPLKRR